MRFRFAIVAAGLLLNSGVAAAKLDVVVLCERCPLPGREPESHASPTYVWLLDTNTGEVWAYPIGRPEKPTRVGKLTKIGDPIEYDKRVLDGIQAGTRDETVRLELGDLFLSEKVFFGEYNTYTTDLVAMNWSPEGTPKYTYGFCNEFPSSEVPGVADFDPSRNHTAHPAVASKNAASYSTSGMTVRKPCEALEKLGLAKTMKADGQTFVAFAIGNTDSDPDLDVWTIDNVKQIKHVRRD